MPTLKFHPAQLREAFDPIPFPRSSWGAAGEHSRWSQGAPVYRFGSGIDATHLAESALDRAERQMERLKALLGDNGDDRPSAA
ncbi:MAG: hypothetical protein JSS51_01995 [Planctomycetes bacterium]|nr:hypothetical protein [Planctomycetota bacterium]